MKRGVFQPNKTRDIAGEKFGSLTAVKFDQQCKQKMLDWLKEEEQS